jgi:hypothetical protein
VGCAAAGADGHRVPRGRAREIHRLRALPRGEPRGA